MAARNLKIDLLKGIGAIAIVLGHALNTDMFYTDATEMARRFVYVFNITIFIFCSGYLFKQKYCENFGQFLKRKIVSLYCPYVQYNLLLWILSGCAATEIERVFMMGSRVDFSGAMWFVPLILLIDLLFCASEWLLQKTKLQKWSFMLYGFYGAVGIAFCVLGGVPWYVKIPLVLMPVFYLGQLYKCWESRVQRVEKWYGAIAFGAAVLVINYLSGKEIEFSLGRVYGGVLLYPVIMIGILFCLCLCALVQKNSWLEQLVCAIGKNSFAVMALHFFVFNLVDRLAVACLYQNKTVEFLSPYTFPKLRVVYVVAGVLLPLAVGQLLKQCNGKITELVKRKFTLLKNQNK